MVIKRLCPGEQQNYARDVKCPGFFNSPSGLLRLQPLNETLVPTKNSVGSPSPLAGIKPEVLMSGGVERIGS
jgi:hypothetical protein